MTEKEFRRRFEEYIPGPLGAQFRSAVLCPLTEGADGLSILLEVRAASLRRQPGEVCFPGGRMEPGETAAECALRETEEELAIPARCIEIFGQSDYLLQHTGAFVQPVLGRVSPEGMAALKPSADEVSAVFTVPVSFLIQHPPAVYQYALTPQPQADFPYEEIGFPGGYPWRTGAAEVPVWHYDGHIIWGITARILKNIIEHLQAPE